MYRDNGFPRPSFSSHSRVLCRSRAVIENKEYCKYSDCDLEEPLDLLAMRTRVRLQEAEAERDAAVEEAAHAIFALHQVQREFAAFTQRESTPGRRCEGCWSAKTHHERHEATRTRDAHETESEMLRETNGAHQTLFCTAHVTGNRVIENANVPIARILEQVGDLAEVIWEATNRPQGDAGCASSTTTAAVQPCTLSHVKLVALERFQSFVPEADRHLYVELHGLHTNAAQAKKREAHFQREVEALVRENEWLKVQLWTATAQTPSTEQLPESRTSGDRDELQERTSDRAGSVTLKGVENNVDERQQPYAHRKCELQLREKDSQLQHLLQMVEAQAAVIASHNVAASHRENRLSDEDGVEEATVAQKPSALSDRDSEDFYEFEALTGCREQEALSLFQLVDQSQDHEESYNQSHEEVEQPVRFIEATKQNLPPQQVNCETSIRLLQAQLEMYVRYFQRKQLKATHELASDAAVSLKTT